MRDTHTSPKGSLTALAVLFTTLLPMGSWASVSPALGLLTVSPTGRGGEDIQLSVGGGDASGTLFLYNHALGRVVRSLYFLASKPPYQVHWDGLDDHGRPAATGSYLICADLLISQQSERRIVPFVHRLGSSPSWSFLGEWPSAAISDWLKSNPGASDGLHSLADRRGLSASTNLTGGYVLALNLLQAAHCRFCVYDHPLGRVVRTWTDLPASKSFQVTWDGNDSSGRPLHSGNYFVLAEIVHGSNRQVLIASLNHS